MKNNECKIINDLLPNYISNLTSNETNKFIEHHLAECDKCKKVYEKMQKNLEINEIKEEEIQIKGFKKINKKFKLLEIIIIILLIILLIGATWYWNYWKNGYMQAAESTYEITKHLDTVDAFYATIEKITDTEMYDNSKILNVKGLEINSQKHREQYEIDVSASTVKIMWNGTEVKTTDFKVGQTILVISFGDPISNEKERRTEIKKIEILNENL